MIWTYLEKKETCKNPFSVFPQDSFPQPRFRVLFTASPLSVDGVAGQLIQEQRAGIDGVRRRGQDRLHDLKEARASWSVTEMFFFDVGETMDD